MSTLLKTLQHSHAEKQTPWDKERKSGIQKKMQMEWEEDAQSMGCPCRGGQRQLQPLFVVTPVLDPDAKIE